MRILIVEDDPNCRVALVELLESEGHDPVAVERGCEAVRKLSPLPDLLILDYNLPDMTGLDILACVAEIHGRLPPVLLVTGQRLSASAWTIAEEMGVRVFRKPVALRELLCSVEDAAGF